MAGAKPSEHEKDQIKELLRQGYRIDEIQQRFPHIDGRSIAGIATRFSVTESGAGSGAGGAAPSPAPVVTSPILEDKGVKDPQREAAETTGFTPQTSTVISPSGFKPGYREYFVVKKLDPPGDGVLKNEYPPFTIQELMERYPPGDYEIQHYRDGRLFTTYREKIAPRNAIPGFSAVVSEPKKSDDPASLFIKAMEVTHRLHSENKAEAANARAMETAALVEGVRAKAQMDQVAITSLVDIVKEHVRPKPDPQAPAIERLFALMQEERKFREEAHRQEMERIREQAKSELEKERERIAAENERFKADLEHRQKMQQDYLAKLQELDAERQRIWKESYDSMIQKIQEVQEGFNRELEEKKRWLEEYSKLQLRHVDEVVNLKKSIGGGSESLEMAKIIKDGITSGLDRVGARIDMLVDKGVIPGKVEGHAMSVVNEREVKVSGNDKEQPENLSKDMIKEAVKEEWFQKLQDEIYKTIERRKKASSPAMKPHGSMLGQSFIDKMNEDPRIRTYFHYLCTRYWNDILTDAGDGIKPEYRELFGDPEAEAWFSEFQEFLTAAWNRSIGVLK